MKYRYYFDTSVFGGVFDDEFRDHSIQLFEQVKGGRVVCLYSELVERELKNAPAEVRLFVNSLPATNLERLEISADVAKLAEKYVSQKVVSKTSIEDCRHIAIATLNLADVLVSWNFKHIVSMGRIKGYNSVNLNLGYKAIDIRSPKDLLSDEKAE